MRQNHVENCLENNLEKVGTQKKLETDMDWRNRCVITHLLRNSMLYGLACSDRKDIQGVQHTYWISREGE